MAATSLMVRMFDVVSTVPPFRSASEGLFVTTDRCGSRRIQWLAGKGARSFGILGAHASAAEVGIGILGALQRWNRRRSTLRVSVRHSGGACPNLRKSHVLRPRIASGFLDRGQKRFA